MTLLWAHLVADHHSSLPSYISIKSFYSAWNHNWLVSNFAHLGLLSMCDLRNRSLSLKKHKETFAVSSCMSFMLLFWRDGVCFMFCSLILIFSSIVTFLGPWHPWLHRCWWVTYCCKATCSHSKRWPIRHSLPKLLWVVFELSSRTKMTIEPEPYLCLYDKTGNCPKQRPWTPFAPFDCNLRDIGNRLIQTHDKEMNVPTNLSLSVGTRSTL